MFFFPKYRQHGIDYVALTLDLNKSNSADFDIEYNTGIMGDKEEDNYMLKSRSMIGFVCDNSDCMGSPYRVDEDCIITHDDLFDSEHNFYKFGSIYRRLHLICEVSFTVID